MATFKVKVSVSAIVEIDTAHYDGAETVHDCIAIDMSNIDGDLFLAGEMMEGHNPTITIEPVHPEDTTSKNPLDNQP